MFEATRDRRLFLRLLDRASKTYDVEIAAYCLMGNHYHLLVRSLSGHLPEMMRDFTSTYVREFNAWNGYDGPLFRSRYQSRLVDDLNYLMELARYIPQNPTALGWGGRLAAYPWSSLASTLSPDDGRDFVTPTIILDAFGSREAYAEYVLKHDWRPADTGPCTRGVRGSVRSARSGRCRRAHCRHRDGCTSVAKAAKRRATQWSPSARDRAVCQAHSKHERRACPTLWTDLGRITSNRGPSLRNRGRDGPTPRVHPRRGRTHSV